jgi:hypothetical protein
MEGSGSLPIPDIDFERFETEHEVSNIPNVHKRMIFHGVFLIIMCDFC